MEPIEKGYTYVGKKRIDSCIIVYKCYFYKKEEIGKKEVKIKGYKMKKEY